MQQMKARALNPFIRITNEDIEDSSNNEVKQLAQNAKPRSLVQVLYQVSQV